MAKPSTISGAVLRPWQYRIEAIGPTVVIRARQNILAVKALLKAAKRQRPKLERLQKTMTKRLIKLNRTLAPQLQRIMATAIGKEQFTAAVDLDAMIKHMTALQKLYTSELKKAKTPEGKKLLQVKKQFAQKTLKQLSWYHKKLAPTEKTYRAVFAQYDKGLQQGIVRINELLVFMYGQYWEQAKRLTTLADKVKRIPHYNQDIELIKAYVVTALSDVRDLLYQDVGGTFLNAKVWYRGIIRPLIWLKAKLDLQSRIRIAIHAKRATVYFQKVRNNLSFAEQQFLKGIADPLKTRELLALTKAAKDKHPYLCQLYEMNMLLGSLYAKITSLLKGISKFRAALSSETTKQQFRDLTQKMLKYTLHLKLDVKKKKIASYKPAVLEAQNAFAKQLEKKEAGLLEVTEPISAKTPRTVLTSQQPQHGYPVTSAPATSSVAYPSREHSRPASTAALAHRLEKKEHKTILHKKTELTREREALAARQRKRRAHEQHRAEHEEHHDHHHVHEHVPHPQGLNRQMLHAMDKRVQQEEEQVMAATNQRLRRQKK